MNNCIEVSESCDEHHGSAQGVLVFPNVQTANIGADAHGAVVQNGEVTGFYTLAVGPAGFTADIAIASYVFVIETPDTLAKIESGERRIDGDTGITVVQGADAKAHSTAEVYSYVLGGRALYSDISVDLLGTRPDAP